MRRIIFISVILFLLLGGSFFYQAEKFNDGKLHIIFCNVGQGDGIFIRTQNGSDIIIDAGPDDSILSCLESHMPFWDRTIEVMILTHPHADHMRGMIPILQNYKVLNFVTEKLNNNTALYNELIKFIANLKIKMKYFYAGDGFRATDDVAFKILGPSKEFLEASSPNGKIGESKEFGSLIAHLSFGSFDILFAGDSQIEGMKEALVGSNQVEIFQIPHHGSKYGTDSEILDILNPQLAVISVGKNNYGHPSPEVLKLLQNYNVKTLRTDRDGEVEIIVDKNGKFSVR